MCVCVNVHTYPGRLCNLYPQSCHGGVSLTQGGGLEQGPERVRLLHTHTHTHTHTLTHTLTHACMHARAHTHAHTPHTHVHTHTFLRSVFPRSQGLAFSHHLHHKSCRTLPFAFIELAHLKHCLCVSSITDCGITKTLETCPKIP